MGGGGHVGLDVGRGGRGPGAIRMVRKLRRNTFVYGGNRGRRLVGNKRTPYDIVGMEGKHPPRRGGYQRNDWGARFAHSHNNIGRGSAADCGDFGRRMGVGRCPTWRVEGFGLLGGWARRKK